MTPLFHQSVIDQHLAKLNESEVKKAFKRLKSLFSASIQQRINSSSELSFQSEFVEFFFDNVLGYTRFPKDNWQIKREHDSETSNNRADAAIVIDSNETKTLAVIELKSTKTHSLQSIEVQVFKYFGQHSLCRYAITSNFQMVRLYVDNKEPYEQFSIFDMVNNDEYDQFKRMYLYLHPKFLYENLPAKIREATIQKEKKITEALYTLYFDFRLELHKSLQKENPHINSFVLFKKTQKLIDRFLFVFFAEDKGLLPERTISNHITEWKKASKVSLYESFKALFQDINVGNKAKNIFAYNGGLFVSDTILDSIRLDIGNVLEVYLDRLQGYDFKSDVDVNILGHIFEQSLNDMDEMKALSDGKALEKGKTKRKKEGVFYTPQYITRYIVDNTIGVLCRKKEQELGIIDGQKVTRNQLDAYSEWLSTVKVLDPACGSGAFLNQTLSFFISEYERIDERMAGVNGKPIIYHDYTDLILANNIFGVDLNEEAVDIAKLSLWLRTAKKGKKLSNLSGNIKMGNSLIDDPSVSDAAFKWKKAFPEVFKQGGFDVVIGNPPYVKGVFTESEKIFYKTNYKTAQYQLDLYILFMEKGVQLLKPNGFISFITPNSWLKNLMMSDCRLFMLNHLEFKAIIPNLPKVFVDAQVDSLIFVAKLGQSKANDVTILECLENQFLPKHQIKQENFLQNDRYVFSVEVNDKFEGILNKMNKGSSPLSDFFEITRGINPYDIYTGQSKETIESKAYHSDHKKDKTFVPEIRGKHANRYFYKWDGKHYISYGDWLAAPRNPKFFKDERIVFREILGKNFECTYISENFVIDRSLYIALPTEGAKKKVNIKYVLALLASKLLALSFRYASNEFDNLFPKIRVAEFKNLPIKVIGLTEQKTFIEKADIMLSENEKLYAIRTNFLDWSQKRFPTLTLKKNIETWYDMDWKAFDSELKKQKCILLPKEQTEWAIYFEKEQKKAKMIVKKLADTDREIDGLVYGLYGLTKEEIKIIEGN